ncbi:AI-2E family transporter [Methylobacter sp.]|uniref:AI-2E family transporter n=1 Tax=Methylobacter sp. TaxID=2051955 RepID=UPI0011F96E56|nr:AI-2E family transporter [Methylobacter sp.]TAK65350.1 MAG: AI-2E family transporter [Methylobacter sp.]
MTNKPEVKARVIGVFILLLLGGWVLHSFISLLAWAVVLAVTTWPIYQRLLINKELHGKATWGAVGLTLLIGAIILAPLGYGLHRLLNEAQSLGQFLTDAQNVGIPAPNWLETLPMIGQWAKNFWIDTLGSAEAAKESLHWLSTGGAVTYTKDFAGQLLHRFFSFLTILLILFFIYQHGDGLSRQILASSRKLFGEIGVRYVLHATAAVRATVNGMVLIGLGKGLLLGVGYALAGLSHPAILGALTGTFAMIPFAAKIIFGACSLVLVAEGHIVAATGLFVYGMILTMIADNYVRPALIGGVVKLPFIWALLGIFAGMETLGLLGLFLGPTLMAVLMSLWRDWIADMDKTVRTQETEDSVLKNAQTEVEQLSSSSATEFDDGQ